MTRNANSAIGRQRAELAPRISKAVKKQLCRLIYRRTDGQLTTTNRGNHPNGQEVWFVLCGPLSPRHVLRTVLERR